MDLITIYFPLATLLFIQQRSTKKKEKQGPKNSFLAVLHISQYHL